MKTILVDAVGCFVSEHGEMNAEMRAVLDSFEHRKIILTNANEEERERFGLTNVPYEVFSLDHQPNKTDPKYYQKMLLQFSLMPNDVVYIEHAEDAVKSAESVGITTLHYTQDITAVETFLRTNA